MCSPMTTRPSSDVIMPETTRCGRTTIETNAFPLFAHQSFSPLPVDSETKFEYQDIQRIRVILEDQEEIDQDFLLGKFENASEIISSID
jgi:hypothetical protein